MPQLRPATRFQRRLNLAFILFSLIWVGLGICLIVWVGEGFGLVALLFGYTLAYALLVGRATIYFQARFRCPECGGGVEASGDGMEGSPALKYCRRCDIDWRIGTS